MSIIIPPPLKPHLLPGFPSCHITQAVEHVKRSKCSIVLSVVNQRYSFLLVKLTINYMQVTKSIPSLPPSTPPRKKNKQQMKSSCS